MSSTERALVELAGRTADAVVGVLEGFLPGPVELGQPMILEGRSALDDFPLPAVAAEVTYTDGASGGNVFVTTLAGARALAASMTGDEEDRGDAAVTSEERAAIAQAMTEGMRAAAQATGDMLGEAVDVSVPEVITFDHGSDASAIEAGAPLVTSTELTLMGEPARLVQFVSKAFVLKMTRALDEIAALELAGDSRPDDAGAVADVGPEDILRAVPLRVCAEIGRASMAVADAVQLPPGGLIELDRGAEEPVDVLVNGQLFATGRLVLVDDEWAVRIENVLLGAEDLRSAAPSRIEH